jgi:rhamnosyltransferase subunit B
LQKELQYLRRTESKRILFATIGSLGDLHPCLALGLELQRRGHSVTIACAEFYRKKIEAHNILFRPMRPHWKPNDQELIRQCETLRTGPEVLFRRLILPHLKDTYQDLLFAARDTDLMISGELVYAAPLVAEKLRLNWVSVILSPSSFFSSRDPSVLVTAPGLMLLRTAGWPVYRAGLNICRLATNHWSRPVRQLRRELGLRRDCDPVFRDKFSPLLVLALFSRWMAEQQPDWPKQTIQPGFVYYDREQPDRDMQPELQDFLCSGDPPVVFTLGSTAVHHPGDFYTSSMEAVRRLGCRAVLVGVSGAAGIVAPKIFGLPYAPYSRVFARSSAIVHQGGSGTTGQALRAGRPMIVVPFGWDQPDNAARVERLGLGLAVSRGAYSSTAASAIDRVLTEPAFAARAAEIGERVHREDALTIACNAIERLLDRVRPPHLLPF